MHSETLFSLVAIVFIFGFYCVPESKRSVYLLPIYPFIAYFIGMMIVKLVNDGSRILRIYVSVLAVLMLVVYAAYICVQCGWVPASVVGHGKHALDNARMLTMLSQQNAWWQWVLVSLPAVIGAMTLLLMGNLRPVAVAAASIIITVTMYWSLSGVLQPGAVNGQSGYELAGFLNHYIPDGPIYSYNSDKAMRHFMADFYTGDRIKPIELTHPGSGYMVIGVNDAKEWLPAHSDEYEFYLLHHFKYRVADVRQQVIVLRFAPK